MKTNRPAHSRPSPVRSERLEARLTESQKILLARAASLHDETMSQFVVRSALRAARRKLRDEQTLQLSRRDAAALTEALANPAAPNKALRSAFKRYKEDFGT